MKIKGIKKRDIETVKREIDKCCEEESADVQISGSENNINYSEIIAMLDRDQVTAADPAWGGGGGELFSDEKAKCCEVAPCERRGHMRQGV